MIKMGRNKKVNPSLLVELLEKYHLEFPNKKIKYAAFGRYVRSKGIAIEDYLLRRYPEITELVEMINSEDSPSQMVASYLTLDVDLFLAKNSSKAKLKAALIQRDQYYKAMADAAASINATNDTLEKKNNELQIKINELTEELTDIKAIFNEKEKMIVKLKRILNDYVYPEIANALLQQEGVLNVVADVIDGESLEKHKISADTDISAYRSELLNELSIDFDK